MMNFNAVPVTVPYTDQQFHGEIPEVGHAGEMLNPGLQHDQFNPPQGQMYPTDSHSGDVHIDGEFTEAHSILVDGGNQFGVSSLCFDTQELLWMGNQGGHVTSYYGIDLQKHTSFQVHANEDVRQILTFERGILALTRSQLRCSIRRGLSLFSYTDPSMHNMQCMLLTGPSSVLLGGHQTKVIELDLEKVAERSQAEVPEPGCAIFRRSKKFICAGTTSGKVTLYDPNTMKAEHVLDAHSGTLSDFDLHGNLLVTCGFSQRMGGMISDRFLMVYDMRVMRAMAPMQVIIDPMFLRFVPTYSNRLAIVSQIGQFQLLEATALTPGAMMMYPISTHGGMVMSFEVSSSCQAMAFGDSSGNLHLFAAGEHAMFNTNPEHTEFADPVEHVQPIHITDELTPFGIIPAIYPANGKLLSEWPEKFITQSQNLYRKPRRIDPEVLRSMQMYHNVGYAPNPGGRGRRNQTPYKTTDKTPSKGKAEMPESPVTPGDDPFVSVPKLYRKVDLKYSKLGLEDFDFRRYNKTHFAGLETHIPNAYCNAMLQMLYFLEPLRVTLLNHICEKEFCLACELGFLFHMLDSQKGQTCQGSNFLRAFRTIPEAAALGLVLGENEETAGRVNLARLIQSWQRFVHQQIHSETSIRLPVSEEDRSAAEEVSDSNSGTPPIPASEDKATESPSSKSKKKKKKGKKKDEKDGSKEDEKDKDTADSGPDPEERKELTSIMSDMFGIKLVTELRCRCGQETQRQSDTSLINLSYPDCSPPGPGFNKAPIMIPFSRVVQHSLTMEQSTQAWCTNCGKYQPHHQRKIVNSIPDVLAFNCQVESERDLEFWKIQLMLLKQQKEEVGDTATAFPLPPTGSPVSCRYGKNCTRRGRGCKFWHESDTKPVTNEPEPNWIPLGLWVVLGSDGGVEVTEVTDEEPIPKEGLPDNTKVYELFGTVSYIKEKAGGNLVSQIKVGETYHQRKERVTCTQWYLFNDFSIEPIEKLDAVQFNLDWKVPCIIYFIRRDLCKYYDLTVRNPIISDVLFDDKALVNPKRRKITFTPLHSDELPNKGDIIALDAEFVSLRQEESELRSDGTRSTIKPSQMSAARISCIRGSGPLEGEPFLDDYITTQEQVVDYLTQFSGIKPGDLDGNISTKHLTNLKSTYQKLRYLVDIGITFVGHGLKKDFRVINLTVPKDQIIDTVELYHLPRQRMISLKFLAWYFLNLNIQSFTHDSVEDSRTALHLYQKYQEMCKEGMDKVRSTIKEMYEVGRKNQWKIPEIGEEDCGAGDNVMDVL